MKFFNYKYDVAVIGAGPAGLAAAITAARQGKKVALFGSYDWGTGEWMELWRERAESAGVDIAETVIANLEP